MLEYGLEVLLKSLIAQVFLHDKSMGKYLNSWRTLWFHSCFSFLVSLGSQKILSMCFVETVRWKTPTPAGNPTGAAPLAPSTVLLLAVNLRLESARDDSFSFESWLFWAAKRGQKCIAIGSG